MTSTPVHPSKMPTTSTTDLMNLPDYFDVSATATTYFVSDQMGECSFKEPPTRPGETPLRRSSTSSLETPLRSVQNVQHTITPVVINDRRRSYSTALEECIPPQQQHASFPDGLFEVDMAVKPLIAPVPAKKSRTLELSCTSMEAYVAQTLGQIR